MENGAGIQWYAVQVRPRHEWSAAKVLNGKGYDPFVPRYKSRHVWSDRKIEIELPLFPGYIFCRFDATVRLPILTTPGVMRIVGTSKVPLPIDAGEIEAIQTVVQLGCKTEPRPFLAVGTKVQVKSGPLTGIEGIVEGYKNRQLILSIGLIQRSVAIDLDENISSLSKPVPASEVPFAYSAACS